MAHHKIPDCTGVWVWEEMSSWGITLIYCNVCRAPGNQQQEDCKVENQCNEWLKVLAREGAAIRNKFLKNRLI